MPLNISQMTPDEAKAAVWTQLRNIKGQCQSASAALLSAAGAYGFMQSCMRAW